MVHGDSEIGHPSGCTTEEIREAVGRVLDSDVIGKRSRLRSLLEYIVEEEIENRGERLKAFAIGIDVLGRGEDFDPNTDSIVRVEVNRLRTLLEEYYANVGREDRVMIEIPRGSYRPQFHSTEIEEDIEALAKQPTAVIPFAVGAAIGFAVGLALCVFKFGL